MNIDSFTLNSLFLSIVIFLPLLGSLVILALPKSGDDKKLPHLMALIFTSVTFLLSILMAISFKAIPEHAGKFNFQFVDKFEWLPSFNISYHVGVDGLSLPMILLTTLIFVVAVLASWKTEKMPKTYFFLMLMMQTAILGVFSSLDLFLFFIMWELEIIPMYFLIGIWGGMRKEYAAMKFILYTALASAFMLIVFIAMYFNTGTFNYIELVERGKPFVNLGLSVQIIAFLGLFVCFAVKLPMFPFHTWLPDAHVEAPTAISIILAGILLKMGAYGIIRICFGLFPSVLGTANTTVNIGLWIGIFGTINIVYGAFLALAQSDMKKVIAYSSISHMGFVLLGLSAMNHAGINGAILQMFTHGTITALMFLYVGVVYDRTHTREIAQLGGLGRKMPLAAAFFVAISLASAAIPGMSSFVSEFLVFIGAFQVHPYLTAISATSIVIGAFYILWLNERVFFGEISEKWKNLPDINKIETFNTVVLLLVVVVIGIYPALLTDIINPATKQLMMIIGI